MIYVQVRHLLLIFCYIYGGAVSYGCVAICNMFYNLHACMFIWYSACLQHHYLRPIAIWGRSSLEMVVTDTSIVLFFSRGDCGESSHNGEHMVNNPEMAFTVPQMVMSGPKTLSNIMIKMGVIQWPDPLPLEGQVTPNLTSFQILHHKHKGYFRRIA